MCIVIVLILNVRVGVIRLCCFVMFSPQPVISLKANAFAKKKAEREERRKVCCLDPSLDILFSCISHLVEFCPLFRSMMCMQLKSMKSLWQPSPSPPPLQRPLLEAAPLIPTPKV